ncbi:hypothetical protein MML48_6g00012608 [Holotrichia oblita]|uniref:Uncharacterized protein n=1 Tax=Holotrichia oblita TaxID=644536 RepID=A0ACB9SXL5_HOLOL|nr:hypothetical protein MML48_6g00012608 [Holotrichia oblita]
MSCIKCNVLINEKSDKIIGCDGCNRSIHIVCSDLSESGIKYYMLHPTSSRRRLKYIYIECEQGVHQIPKLIVLINNLKDEIKRTKDKYEQMSVPHSSPTPLQLPATEEIISEIYERNKREQNIIIYGYTEQAKSTGEQTATDIKTARTILNETGVAVEGLIPPKSSARDQPPLINHGRFFYFTT